MSIEPSPFLDLQPSSTSVRHDFQSEDSTAPKRVNGRSSLIPTSRIDNTRENARRELSLALRDKVKELVQLAQEQGHLTREDVNETFPPDEHSQEELEEVNRR